MRKFKIGDHIVAAPGVAAISGFFTIRTIKEDRYMVTCSEDPDEQRFHLYFEDENKFVLFNNLDTAVDKIKQEIWS